MTDLQTIIGIMLPGDTDLGIPSASVIRFDDYLRRHNLEALSVDFAQILDTVCAEKYSQRFSNLDSEQKLEAINACRLANIRVFSSMVEHLFKAYYTTPVILEKIGAGTVPPFPRGNFLGEDDWSLLEPVYERGLIYRELD
ncbi:hypothetical protein AOB54_01860 [beta proteobacterium MWH-UniP1]